MKPIIAILFLTCVYQIMHAQVHTYVRVVSKDNFTHETDSILSVALPLIDSVVNTAAFRQGIFNARFRENKGLSNQTILNLFLGGKEVSSPIANDTIDLYLETYPDQRGDNIGSTFNSHTIVSSQAYILRKGARCYAAHIVHEYCHTIGNGKIGFEHPHNTFWPGNKRKKCQSVPYIIGDLARIILGINTCNFECENYQQQ